MMAIVTACDGTEPAAEPEVDTAAIDAANEAAEEAAEDAPVPITLTYLVDDSEPSQLSARTLADAYVELHPHVTIEIENRPQGGDGDNVVKTRLATGDMTDVFWYNAGSLLQALQPAETLVDLTDEPFMDNVDDAFKQTVARQGVPSPCATPKYWTNRAISTPRTCAGQPRPPAIL